MDKPGIKPRNPEEIYGPALEKARRDLATLNPMDVAGRSGANYVRDGCYFQLQFFGKEHRIFHKTGLVQLEKTGEEPTVPIRLILLHYLIHADGAPMADRWVSFWELPGGRIYNAAFQARANLRLARAFEKEPRKLITTAEALGGERLSYGDASFLFRVLPRLWMAVVFYQGDEEFPASANILFDGAAGHYLPTEDLAVLGGLLAGRLLRG
ncbi:MAG: DUF3786 domain-containing protein [Anaerolineae bacterium]